jgi:hypothetical protein
VDAIPSPCVIVMMTATAAPSVYGAMIQAGDGVAIGYPRARDPRGGKAIIMSCKACFTAIA